jgi:BNR repeat-containing family member
MELKRHRLIKLFLLIPFLFLPVSAQVKIVPIAEGWAKNQVNAVIFRKNSLASFKDSQFAAFYDGNSRVVVAKRKLNSTKWEIHPTQFSGQTADAHNSISIAVDGRGLLHLAWNHHNVPLNYARSLKPESLEFSAPQKMVGTFEDKVTYPEFYNLPNGDLLFFYRDGGSGNGNLILNRYDAKTQRWSRVQNNLVDGEGKRNAYPQMTVDAKGAIHLSWVWRETPNVATNHDLCYAVSNDGGATWRKSSGEKYDLPIRAENAEYIWRIPQNSELINQTSMTTDARGLPYIATYWRDADSMIPQYRIVYFDGARWRESQVSNRKTPFSLSGTGTKKIPVSRPQIVAFPHNGKPKIIVIFRDEERGNRVSAAISTNLSKNVWKILDLSETEIGNWEPTFDPNIWNRKKELHLFVQKVGQGDGEKLENLPAQMISVLEWKPE